MDKTFLLDRAARSSEERMLLSRVLDKYEQSRRRNQPTHTPFLSPAERASAEDLLRAAAIHDGFAFSGGYEGAERTVLFFLPDWQEEAEVESAMAFLRAAFRSGERVSHRDMLGSIMGLSLTREVIGDILVGEESADIVVSAEVAPYLMEQLTSAGHTALRLCTIEQSELRIPERRVKEIRDTVATLRLDAVAATGFAMSRTKAAELISSGAVQKNHRPVTKADAPVGQGDVISARGLGKFEVAEVGGLSKKGRTGILLRRYL
ncbi:MAG: hypothetical protein IKD01_03460 [Oscillospiraceae bacterium]|nr:hypothetical protein [Oscillospiraceae bacterium]